MTLLERAERAALGALLHTPRCVTEISSWLVAGDFLHPRHEHTYDLIVRLAHADRLTPQDLLREAMADDDARRNHVDGPFIHRLLAEPGHPNRPAAYARMVLEASVRRGVTTHFDAADHAFAPNNERAISSCAAVELPRIKAAIDELARRWKLATTEPDWPVELPSTARKLQRPDDPWLRNQELATVSALLSHPESIRNVRAWLSADDFADRELGEIFRAMQWLDDRAEPIDPLTIAWEVERAGVTVDPGHVRALADAAIGQSPMAAAHELVRLRAEATLRQAVRAVHAASDRPEINPGTLLHVAAVELSRIPKGREPHIENYHPSPSSAGERLVSERL